MAHIITKGELPGSESTHTFEGAKYRRVGVSFILDGRMQPGSGPRLHAYPYAEVFVVQPGAGTGGRTRTESACQMYASTTSSAGVQSEMPGGAWDLVHH